MVLKSRRISRTIYMYRALECLKLDARYIDSTPSGYRVKLFRSGKPEMVNYYINKYTKKLRECGITNVKVKAVGIDKDWIALIVPYHK